MHVAFRADGSSDIGMGHLVRTRTLSAALRRRGHETTLLTKTPEAAAAVAPAALRAREDVETALRAGAFDVLIVDLPSESKSETAELGSLELYERLAAHTEALVVVEDYVDLTVHCDLLINGHIYAERDAYDWTGSEPTWLLGGDYLIFDEAIRSLADRAPPWREPPERGLVAMGGSDVSNVTPAAMRAFDDRNLAVDVVVGPGFAPSNREAIRRTAEAVDCRFSLHDDPDDLASLMFEADVAVSALGLMAYEFLALRTPMIGAVIAPDQRPKAAALREADTADIVDDTGTASFRAALDTLLNDPDRRRTLRNRGRKLVDPDGVDRIVDEIERLAD